ncbi:MAG: S9 family peptidase [Gemmatimonadaceae bacterium]|nr:S9 family peptidase [Gemmatimonadaceae bacterium]
MSLALHSTGHRLLLAGLVGAGALQAQAPAQPRAMTLRDWYRVTTVSQPAVSPDGGRVAFTVMTVREAENKRHQEVWVAALDGSAPQRWTSPGYESSAPRWSPDGKSLLFTSTRPGGKGTTWVLRTDVPGGEAMQLPTMPSQGSTPASGQFAVWSDAAPADTTSPGRDPYARMGALARPPFDAITLPADPARFDGRHFVDFPFKSNDRNWIPGRRTARTYRPTQLWKQAYGDTTKVQLTRDAYSHRSPVVSPDGQWVAFIADARLRSDSLVEKERDSLGVLPYNRVRDEAERNDADIYVMPVAGGAPRKVAEWLGAESDLEWSKDGRQIAFIGRPARTKSARIYVVDVAGGTPRNLLGSWQYEPDAITWLPTGAIRFTASIGGRAAILDADMNGGAPRELVGGRRRATGISLDANARVMAYVSTSMTKPTELFVSDASGGNERQVTHFNDALNADVAWSDAERFTYRSVGNLEIEGWLMKPYGYEPGRKYPVVLYIHGGPHSQYNEGWFDEFQNLAAQGMFVLFTNPRGSSGYGADFTYVTRGRWGLEDYDDLMKATDIIARRADIDSTKMGATGGSYGGFMTTWLATKTTRFAAIETDRTITDWTYWYGASDVQGLTEFEFYGKPWDNQALYDRLSPIRYVKNVKTPMLIVQSEEDFRTAMGSAEMWYTSLKKLGVPAELVRYPRSTHELSRAGEPWLLVDRLGRLRQWFGYWLQGTKATAPAATAAGGGR